MLNPPTLIGTLWSCQSHLKILANVQTQLLPCFKDPGPWPLLFSGFPGDSDAHVWVPLHHGSGPHALERTPQNCLGELSSAKTAGAHVIIGFRIASWASFSSAAACSLGRQKVDCFSWVLNIPALSLVPCSSVFCGKSGCLTSCEQNPGKEASAFYFEHSAFSRGNFWVGLFFESQVNVIY